MTSIENAAPRARRRRIAACAGLVAVLCLGALPARAGDLAAQCWSPAALAGRIEEKPPRRGGSASSQQAPQVRLAAFAPVPAAMRGAIRRVRLPKGQKLVALTFDFCEQPGEVAGYDGAIVDYLRANDLRATFFAGGKWLVSHAERAEQLLADARFEMASHGWAHRNVRGLDAVSLAAEVVGPQRAYEQTRARFADRRCVAADPAAMSRIPKRLSLYRFPYGACNPAALDALAANGLLAVQWDVSSGDASKATSPDAIVRNVLGSVRPGSIVLMHANGRGYNTAVALAKLVPQLRARGYRLVTVGELLASGTPEITPTCYDHRPGDTDRYDKLFQRPKGAPRATVN